MFVFYWFWMILLLPVPILIRKFFPIIKNDNLDNNIEILFPNIDRLKKNFLVNDFGVKKENFWQIFIISLVWILLVLSVMRPQITNKMTSIKTEGYDIMLAVDISGSMKALDFSTRDHILERLDITKEVVSKFAKGRSGDRLGLVLFGEKAHLYVPLTLDTISISKMLNNSFAGMAGNATAIGDAIGIAVKNLRNRKKGSRVIILLTDGDDTASSISPIKATELAKQYGIRIYTIAIGKNGKVPYPNGMGGIVMVEMNIDVDLLKKISSITGGKYYAATDKDTLISVYKEIDKLEKTESEKKEYIIKKPLYQYPLGAALLLFSIFCFIPILKGLKNEF